MKQIQYFLVKSTDSAYIIHKNELIKSNEDLENSIKVDIVLAVTKNITKGDYFVKGNKVYRYLGVSNPEGNVRNLLNNKITWITTDKEENIVIASNNKKLIKLGFKELTEFNIIDFSLLYNNTINQFVKLKELVL